ncbi:MAG: hypothetical protein FDZ69_06475 [Deltaproteobacteria bacterium]|nr:MAG: hypothetical protein FDZ69_06475 [Deltaproteobacteria bacterium]
MTPRRAIVFCALCLFLSGCAATTVTGIIHPTQPPPVKSTKRPVSLASKRILVLSPTSIEQVSGTLTNEIDNYSSRSGETRAGIVQTTDYNVALSAAEKALLDSNWQPVSQASLEAAASDKEVQRRLDELYKKGKSTLLQTALILGKATNTSAVLLLRSIELGFQKAPMLTLDNGSCSARKYQPLSTNIDAVLIDSNNGNVLWTGQSSAISSDLFHEPVTMALGPKRAQYARKYGSFVISNAIDDESDCRSTNIDGLICIEQGNWNCVIDEKPVNTQANHELIELAMTKLLDSLSLAAK